MEVFSHGLQRIEPKMVEVTIRNRLSWAIEELSPQVTCKKTVLLFLPKGQTCELYILYVHYKLKKVGYSVINLGVNVVNSKVKEVSEAVNPRYLITYTSSINDFAKDNELETGVKSDPIKKELKVITSNALVSEGIYKNGVFFIYFEKVVEQLESLTSEH